MKKAILKSALIAVASVGLTASGAMATPVGNALQDVFNDITVGGDSSVNAQTDALSDDLDSYWQVGATGASVSTLVIELASFADDNIFGVYNGTEYVQLFGGSAVAGNQVTFGITKLGDVYVNGVDTLQDFSGNIFGYYLDSTANTGGGVWHSDTALNDPFDGLDHMLAYQGVGDQVEIAPWSAGPWGSNEYILAWEDLYGPYSDPWVAGISSDRDFTDFVVMVESVSPVPEPATMLLFGTGLIGLAGLRRKKSQKDA